LLRFLYGCAVRDGDKKDDSTPKARLLPTQAMPLPPRRLLRNCKERSRIQDAKAQCATYTPEATKQLNRFNQNYLEGVGLMQEGSMRRPSFKFRNVKFRVRVKPMQKASWLRSQG